MRNEALAIGWMVARLGNSTIRFFGSSNFKSLGTSDSRISVSATPVSARVWMLDVVALAFVCGVVIKTCLFELNLIERFTALVFATINPNPHEWPPATSVGDVAAIIC